MAVAQTAAKFFRPATDDSFGDTSLVGARARLMNEMDQVTKVVDTMAEHKHGGDEALQKTSAMLHGVNNLCRDPNVQVGFSPATSTSSAAPAA